MRLPGLTAELVVGVDAIALGAIAWLGGPLVAARWPELTAWLAVGRTVALVTGLVLVLGAVANGAA